MPGAPFRSLIATLRRYYGRPPRPISRDPFRLILWEQVAYLVPDARRRQAFAALRTQVGLTPAAILSADDASLRAVARLGGPIAADVRAGRLRASAELVIGRWNGNLRAALRLPLAEARKAIAQFAMIGEPGADKILVFCRRARFLPLDSNALRVLGRVGLTTDQKDYRTTYRRAQATLAPLLPEDPDSLIDAYHLLRRHGQVLCRTSEPACPPCPLLTRCDFAAGRRRHT
jgi:endonuclease-3